MDTDDKNVHFRRGLLFQDFALVEMAMNRLICLYFLKEATNTKFISELLENECFSFQLRKKMFKIAFNECYPGLKFPWKSLERIQHLRNISAHSRLNELTHVKENGEINKIKKPFYTHNNEEIQVKILHDEFKKHMDNIIITMNLISDKTFIKFK